jgi:hypothetical protein
MRSTANDWTNLLPGVPDVESPFFDDIFSRKAAKPGWFEIATAMRRDGFAVMHFPDDQFDALAAEIIDRMVDRFDWRAWRKRGWVAGGGLREQDAWTEVDAVRCIAVNEEVCELLEYLYGRKAFPFQTLNFPVGTQQHFHTDSIHFSSLPERFMCGVWVALEDIDADNGPLIYYPGSHALPIFKNEHIGHLPDGKTSQIVYHDMWVELMRVKGIEPVEFHARKGQALIWSANLFHGGKRQADAKRTRWSQVTHYLFEGCSYYTPMNSDETVGLIDLRSVPDISSGEVRASRTAVPAQPVATLPEGFDPVFYLKANPDVQAAGADPAEHFLRYGRFENRRWRR